MTDTPNLHAGEFIAPVDTDQVTAAERKARPAGTPLPFSPSWDREMYYVDCGFLRPDPSKPRVPVGDRTFRATVVDPPPAAIERADRYYQNFQIIDAPTGPQIRDSMGTIWPVPTGVVGVATIAYGVSFLKREWLRLHDASGRTLMIIPNYGWDELGQLYPFIFYRFGWTSFTADKDLQASRSGVEKAYPGWNTALIAHVGQPMIEPTILPRHWWQKR